MCFGIRFYKSCGCPGLSLPACPLVGMTPPPGSLLRKQGKPGQVYYSQQIGKIQIPYFAPPAASRIGTKTLCPAAWCISAPYPRTRIMRPCFFQPPAGRKGTSDRLRLSKVLLRYFRESNKAYASYPALVTLKQGERTAY